MNTAEKMPSVILAVCKSQYRGVFLWQTGDDIRIWIGKKEYIFVSLEEATAFIDAAMAAVVTIH